MKFFLILSSASRLIDLHQYRVFVFLTLHRVVSKKKMSAKKYPQIFYFLFFNLPNKGVMGLFFLFSFLFIPSLIASPPLKNHELLTFQKTIRPYIAIIQKESILKKGHTLPQILPTGVSSKSSMSFSKINRLGIWLTPQVIITSSFNLEPEVFEDRVYYVVSSVFSSPLKRSTSTLSVYTSFLQSQEKYALHLQLYAPHLGIALFVVSPLSYPRTSTLPSLFSLSKEHSAWASNQTHLSWFKPPSVVFKTHFLNHLKHSHPSWFTFLSNKDHQPPTLHPPLYIDQSPPKRPSSFVLLGSAPFPLQYFLWAVGQSFLGTPLFNSKSQWETFIVRPAPLELSSSTTPHLLIAPKYAIVKVLKTWLQDEI